MRLLDKRWWTDLHELHQFHCAGCRANNVLVLYGRLGWCATAPDESRVCNLHESDSEAVAYSLHLNE
jgi:hypothetical protein